MLCLNTRNSWAIAHHNGDPKFTNGPVIFSVDDVFRRTWKPEWINSDFARRIITDVDHKDILNSEDPLGDLAYKYHMSPIELCTGTKNCLLARFFVKHQRIFMTMMGRNCYKYLMEASDYKDVKATIDIYPIISRDDLKGHQIYFEDLDVISTTAPQFVACMLECERRGLFGPNAEGGRWI